MTAVAGWVLLACAVFVTFDVLARNFLGFNSKATVEITGYCLAFGIAWGLAGAFVSRVHVRIDVFIQRLPEGVRGYLHALAVMAMAVFAGVPRVWRVVHRRRVVDLRRHRHQRAATAAVDSAGPVGVRHPDVHAAGRRWIRSSCCGCWRRAGRTRSSRCCGRAATRKRPPKRWRRSATRTQARRSRRVIAVVFLLVLLVVTGLRRGHRRRSDGVPVGPDPDAAGAVPASFFGVGHLHRRGARRARRLIAGFAFSDRPFWAFLGQMIWGPSTNFVLVAVPLFLLMGEILLRAGLSDRLYRALNVWLNRMPGGLLHTNIVACARVLGDHRVSASRPPPPWASVALPYFQGTALRPAHGAGLARRRRRARQPDPAGHHLHHLRR